MNKIETLGLDWISENLTQFVSADSAPFISYVAKNQIVNSSGVRVDHNPCTGTVVLAAEILSIVLTNGGDFVILDNKILSEPLTLGSRVTVTPYARRHFSGIRVDQLRVGAANDEPEQAGRLGSSSVSRLPVETPKTDEGKHVLDYLHRARCPDGLRVLSNLLVDIGATNMAFIESKDKMALVFDCNNSLFNGRVVVSMEYDMQSFCVELFKVEINGTETLQHKHENVGHDDLTSVMTLLLCDGRWMLAQVEVHAPATATAEKE